MVVNTCFIFICCNNNCFALFFFRNRLPPCSSPSPCCGKASPGSSGSESTVVHGRLRGRWTATRWSAWRERLRPSTGSAGRTWPGSRSTVTPPSAEPRFGSRSRRSNLPNFLNTSTSKTTWVISTSPRRGDNASRGAACKDCLHNGTMSRLFVQKNNWVLFCVSKQHLSAEKLPWKVVNQICNWPF